MFCPLILALLGSVAGLFEDQAFKLDWKASFVGHVSHAGFHSSGRASVLVVATESHVLAGLDSDSGSLLWRHAQEQSPLGRIQALALTNRHAVTVSGEGGILLLRLWDPLSGALVQEHLVQPGRPADVVSVQGGRLVMVNFDGSELQVVQHSFDSKKLSPAESRVVPSPFPATSLGQAPTCVVSSDLVLVCSYSSSLHTLDLGARAATWQTKEAGGQVGGLRVVGGTTVEADTAGGLVRLHTGTGRLEKGGQGRGVRREGGCGGVSVSQACMEEGVGAGGEGYCRAYSRDLEVGGEEGGRVVHALSQDRGGVEGAWALCEEGAWQLVVLMQDGALLSLTPRGNLMFLREEGLADITLVQMVAVGQQEQLAPQQHETVAALLDPSRLLQSFVTRIRRHVSQLQGLMLAVTDFRLSGRTEAGMGADRFGLRKVVVVATGRGKLYGLDSSSGAVLWQARVEGRPSALHLQRDGRTDSEAAVASLVYRHARSTHFVLSFNPITGLVLDNTPVSLELSQALLLPETPDSSLRPLLLVGRDSRAQLLPPSAAAQLALLPRMFVVTEQAGHGLTGNLVTVAGDGVTVSLTPVWSLETPGTRVLHVRTRQQDEKVHSAGRVLEDRSVLFKYMNPNLALVLAEGQDSASKTFITIQVVDLVTGRVFYSATHRKVTGPFHAVLSENWAVYTFSNEKARRTELVSLELYEGKSQHNNTMFSSIENTVVPLVERQAYILPVSEVAALQETITDKGITAKHLLVAGTQGAILDLPLHMVDPRRPGLDTPAHLREPGIPPYIPELPVPPESILNYNQSVTGVRGITASPSGLESTVLVFVHGLDLYGTRIAPSKGFDLIKDDFEHLMIAGVLVFLVAASFGTRKLAQRKMLNQAWK